MPGVGPKYPKPSALVTTTITVHVPTYLRERVVDELRLMNQNMVLTYIDEDGALRIYRTHEGSDLIEWGQANVF